MRSLEHLSPDFLENPWPVYAKLRREHPVWWCDEIRMFCVFGYKNVRMILRDPRFTVSHPFRITKQVFGETLVDMEGPEHLRLRKRLSVLVSKANLEAFSREVAEPRIIELVRNAAKSTPLDFMRDIAERVPAIMICHFLGLPPEDERWLFENMMVLMRHLEARGSFEEASRVNNDVSAWLDEKITALLNETPASRTCKRLIDVVRDESPETLKSLYFTFLAGGIETSVCLLGNAAALLSQNQDWFARFADEPAIARAILDEVLRLEPAQGSTVRFAAQDLEIDGVTIRRGQAINVLIASAARDEAVFSDPDTFDPMRKPTSGLAFGVGPHACIGKNFTLMNTETTLRALWQALGGVQRAGDMNVVIRGSSFRRPQSLFLEASTNSTLAT